MDKESTKIEIDIIPKFLDSALTPAAKEAGERLADIVSLVFTPVIKAKAKRDKNIEQFLKQLDNEVNNIPEDKLQAPPLNIVGPIIDNVFKFYHDEEYLRKMYATLIASSMNSDKKVHPSHAEIIRQLSSNDAAIFNMYFQLPPTAGLISASEQIFLTTRHQWSKHIYGIDSYFPLFFLEEGKIYYVKHSVSSSLQLLIRLGLIYVSNPIKKSHKILKKSNVVLETTGDVTLNVSQLVTEPTSYGRDFAEACCAGEINKSCIISKNTTCLQKIITHNNCIKFVFDNNTAMQMSL